jgi:hypothetical protein
MGVPVHAGATFTAGTPTKVLDAKYFNGGANANARTYDVARDGRFLMIKGSPDDGDARADRLVVVVNWREELRETLASK